MCVHLFVCLDVLTITPNAMGHFNDIFMWPDQMQKWLNFATDMCHILNTKKIRNPEKVPFQYNFNVFSFLVDITPKVMSKSSRFFCG